jgi:glycosyltransferase involved in cell wall biosynthesis
MVKVSIIVGNLASTGEGRWISRTFLIAEALKRNGYEVEMLGYLFGESNVDLSNQGYPIYTFPGQNYPDFLCSMWRLHKQISGDIIYALKLKVSSFGTALLHQRLTKKPLILDIDDWELGWFGGNSYRYRPSLRALARDILKPQGFLRQPDAPPYLQWIESQVKRADAITIHTSFMRDRFGGSYLANGKSLELFDPALYHPEVSRKKYGLDPFKVLIFPGAPRPYKGLEDVLEALDLLDWPDLRLVIVGGSPYDDYDQKLMSRWPKRLIQLPTFDYAQMPEVISAAHVLVVPQRDTPATLAQFPLKITDGMAMAKPVLASRVGDIPEILGDTGFLVPPSNPSDIAQAIEFIFGHWEHAMEQGQRARQRCSERYSIECMAESLEQVLTSLDVKAR